MPRLLSRHTVYALVLFAITDLAFTALNMQVFGTSHSSGGLRPLYTILPKIIQLAMVGGALGALASIPTKHIDLELVAASAGFIILVDVDHLPVLLGIPQPIRPSHSIPFMITAALAIHLVTRNGHLSILSASALTAHLALDKPLFPLLAPLSPNLYEYGLDVRIGLAALSVGLALLAGATVAKRQNH